MKHLPIFFDIRQKPCLVVGAGSIAARKIEILLKADADVVVIAKSIGSEVTALEKKNAIRCQLRGFNSTDLKGMRLVIAATDDAELNASISVMAQAANIPVNVVDNLKLCSFLMPSIIDRNPIQIAISTGGASPVLARLLRAKLEASIPAAYGELAKLVQNYRIKVKKAFSNVDLRRRFWESVLEGPVTEFAFSGRMKDAETLLDELIESAEPDPEYKGEVYLVGAGPGDPDLLTFKALRLMQKCDVVVYDMTSI